MTGYGEKQYRKETNRKGRSPFFCRKKREKSLFHIAIRDKKDYKRDSEEPENGFSGRKKGSGGNREKYFAPYDGNPASV